MDDTLTETNDAVHDALETAAGAPVQVVYIRNGEQFQTRDVYKRQTICNGLDADTECCQQKKDCLLYTSG